jgi:hypothetical protein
MKYDKSFRIIQEPSFLMKIVNFFRDKCRSCGEYKSHVARFIPECVDCWNDSLEEYAKELREREDRKKRAFARMIAEEINRC